MTESYRDRIAAFCASAGIRVPAGFYRGSAAQYAVIDMDSVPPKLVANTWFKQADVVYYLNNFGEGRKLRVLDFKNRRELIFDGGERLKTGPAF
jgi:hypothetical protein